MKTLLLTEDHIKIEMVESGALKKYLLTFNIFIYFALFYLYIFKKSVYGMEKSIE